MRIKFQLNISLKSIRVFFEILTIIWAVTRM